MAEILVKSPLTTNGRDPLYGEDGKPMFREDILNANAKSALERINAKKPKHLQAIITDIKPAEIKKDDKAK